MVDQKSLGKLKLEHYIKRGYFISAGAKTYCLINSNGSETKKAKALNSNTPGEDDYIEMYLSVFYLLMYLHTLLY